MKTLPALALGILSIQAFADGYLERYLPAWTEKADLYATHSDFLSTVPTGIDELRHRDDMVSHLSLRGSEAARALNLLREVRIGKIIPGGQQHSACREKDGSSALWEFTREDGGQTILTYNHHRIAPSNETRLCLYDGENTYTLNVNSEDLQAATQIILQPAFRFATRTLSTPQDCTGHCADVHVEYAQTSSPAINRVLNTEINRQLELDAAPAYAIPDEAELITRPGERDISLGYQGATQTAAHRLHGFILGTQGYNHGAPRAYAFTTLITVTDEGTRLSLAEILREGRENAFLALLGEQRIEPLSDAAEDIAFAEATQRELRQCFATVPLTDIGFHLDNTGLTLDFGFCDSFGNVENPNTDLHIPLSRLRPLLKDEYLPQAGQ